MSKERLVISMVVRDGREVWQLVHVGWFRTNVLAESFSPNRIVEMLERFVQVLE